MELNKLTLKEALEKLKSGEITSRALTEACLFQIERKDPETHAFVTITRDLALQQAKEADDLIVKIGKKAFDEKPLLGIPYALKDNFCTDGVVTTASSNVLKNFVPPYESTVSKKLKEAGAVLLGKTNLDAFAHGSSTETSDFGPTKNPHDLSKSAGGSSGGSAAAVASNMCIFAVGSETAGSIRQPASWCGVVGLKPTFGLVSRYGLIAMASSTDSPGPITKTVGDAEIILDVIQGQDGLDVTSTSRGTMHRAPTDTNPKLKIGIASSYFVKGIDPKVAESVKVAVEKLKEQGYEVKEIDLLDPKYSIAVYTVIQRSEVSSNLARLDGIRYGNDRRHFGAEAKRRIMLGTYTLSAGYYDQFYTKAQKVRTLIVNDFKKAFKEVDVIIGPTSPVTALPLGLSEKSAMFGEIQDQLLEPSSLAGLPGISIPCGIVNGLPVGLQIIGDRFKEEKILQVAKDLEMSK